MPQNFLFALPLTKKFAPVNYNEKKLEVNREFHRLELEVEGNIKRDKEWHDIIVPAQKLFNGD